ncbi:hypothetical protein E8E13_008641 [Curvularia kusanoi]|uniref:Uncharacterized protein n=1 Tax=Curvularia kusanoi TaxID=90978 RepID=A0A9P4TF82_CURKU|nr:hypothetical protein E8E13_008641 [Curvularia kusanoi]
MQLSRFLFSLCWLLLPVALSGTTWLYLYPFFQNCAFPQPTNTSLPLLSSRAPFRLLALGDPQLEGDSSLPDPDAPVFPSLANVSTSLRNANFEPREVRNVLAAAATGALKDTAAWLEGYRKTIDLWGNDWYLAHIVRSLRWWTEPTHISVLGDLLGSQWITDGEFEKRAGRYWGTVMRGLQRVPDGVMGVESESDHYDEPGFERSWGGRVEVLGQDEAWATRVINIAGNHDIGYAGDIDVKRVERFERAFGSVNWDVWFTLPHTPSSNNTSSSGDGVEVDAAVSSAPALRLVVLNTMNLDTPAYTDSLQQQTYAFMNHIVSSSRPVTDKSHATILLTHIPLHKPPGVCVDSPYFDFFEGGHGVREQNMLSEYGSKIVLESIFGLSGNAGAEGQGLGRRGLVVNGHDHEGCDVLHWIRQDGVETCESGVLEQRRQEWVAALDADALLSSVRNETRDSSADDADPLDNSDGAGDPDAEQEVEAEEEKQDTGPQWRATRFPPRATHHFSNSSSSSSDECTHIPSSPNLREITLRSMMGEFGGHAGFLSAWFDPAKGEEGEWVLEFASCAVGVQHWWWGVHIVDLIAGVAVLGAWVARGVERAREGGGGEAVSGKRGQGDGGKKVEGGIGGEGKAKKDIVAEKEKGSEVTIGPGAKSLAQAKKG